MDSYGNQVGHTQSYVTLETFEKYVNTMLSCLYKAIYTLLTRINMYSYFEFIKKKCINQ